MKTQVKNSSKRTSRRTSKPSASPLSAFQEVGEFISIDVNAISFSPFNYRNTYSLKALEDFAAELAIHHVISPITVRPIAEGKFELVAGERRLRASKMAGLATIPAVVRELTDEQVIEIQLSENIQRENPHPLQEAKGIGRMKEFGYTMEEIAIRLGKSKTFVYSRLKLMALIPPFQDMLMAEKVSLQDALQIAALSSESQEDFYNEECAESADDPDFELELNNYSLRSYQYNLRQAPFDTRVDNLLENVVACTQCPSNTATLQTLFPELSENSICTNRSCFQRKCMVHHAIQLATAFAEHRPVGLIYYGTLPSDVLEVLQTLPIACDLPHFQPHQVNMWNAPVPPDKQEYLETGEEGEETFDEAAFQDEWQDYEIEKAEYEQALLNEEFRKGLFINTNRDMRPVLFSIKTEVSNTGATGVRKQVAAKDVQEALKTGTATPELLQAEIERINRREVRSAEIDREKVQSDIHKAFTETTETNLSHSLTEADQVAARLLVFQSLPYGTKHTFKEMVPAVEQLQNTSQNIYNWLASLSNEAYSTMIRMAIAGKSEAKSPNNETAYCLYQLAEQAGTDVAAIEQAQQEKADKRKLRLRERIVELQNKIEKLSNN